MHSTVTITRSFHCACLPLARILTHTAGHLKYQITSFKPLFLNVFEVLVCCCVLNNRMIHRDQEHLHYSNRFSCRAQFDVNGRICFTADFGKSFPIFLRKILVIAIELKSVFLWFGAEKNWIIHSFAGEFYLSETSDFFFGHMHIKTICVWRNRFQLLIEK